MNQSGGWIKPFAVPRALGCTPKWDRHLLERCWWSCAAERVIWVWRVSCIYIYIYRYRYPGLVICFTSSLLSDDLPALLTVSAFWAALCLMSFFPSNRSSNLYWRTRLAEEPSLVSKPDCSNRQAWPAGYALPGSLKITQVAVLLGECFIDVVFISARDDVAWF